MTNSYIHRTVSIITAAALTASLLVASFSVPGPGAALVLLA